MTVIDREQAVRQAIEFLGTHQLPSGEFRTIVAKDTRLTKEPRHDPSPFATAHIVSCLAACRLESCTPLISLATGYLRGQVLPGGLWKFWSKDHPGHRSIPADLDDTCVVSLALHDARIGCRQNVGILLGNRDAQGRFFTWFQPRMRHLTIPGSWRHVFPATGSARGRKAFFAVGEARRSDVDVVVNANVVCWLATTAAKTPEAAAWVLRVVEAGEEVRADRYYQSRYALYYAVARGVRFGVAAFSRAASVMRTAMLDQANADGSIGRGVQETAIATTVLATVGGPKAVIQRAISFLLARQRPDGSWPAESYYYGGWSRDYCWGCPELTTAFCIEAITVAGGCARG